jgi:alpha-beta hydrolase superfamily lysophospholipase
MYWLASLTLSVTGGYTLLVLYLYFRQGRLLYLPDTPTRTLQASPADRDLAYESLELVTEDGVALHAWWVPAPHPRQARATVLFFHGNAGNISHRMDRLLQFHQLGLNTLILDYRGYGQSEGAPSEEGTYRDAQAGWDHLVRERKIPPARVLIFGHSLGGAVAAELASRQNPGGLVIEASFLSVPEVAAHHYRWLPVRWISRYRYDSRAVLEQVRCPVLISHSREDEVVPFEHGRGLYSAAREPKWFMEIVGDHDRGFLTTGEAYVRQLDRLVDDVFGSAAPRS